MQEGAFPEDLWGLGDSKSTVGPGLKTDTQPQVLAGKIIPWGTMCLGQKDTKSPKSKVARAVMEGTLSQNLKLWVFPP